MLHFLIKYFFRQIIYGPGIFKDLKYTYNFIFIIIIIISSEFYQLVSNDYSNDYKDQLANKDLGATALPPPLIFLHNYTHSINNIIESFKSNTITTNFYIIFLQIVKVANFCCLYLDPLFTSHFYSPTSHTLNL